MHIWSKYEVYESRSTLITFSHFFLLFFFLYQNTHPKWFCQAVARVAAAVQNFISEIRGIGMCVARLNALQATRSTAACTSGTSGVGGVLFDLITIVCASKQTVSRML